MTNITILSENLKLKSKIAHYLVKENYTVTAPDAEMDFSTINLILYDLTGSQLSDLSFITNIKIHNPFTPIVVLVNQGDVEVAVKAMRAGAVNALATPLDRNLLIKSVEDELTQPQNTHFQRDQTVIQQAIDLLQSLQVRSGNITPGMSASLTLKHYPNGIIQVGDLIINLKQEKVFYQKALIELTYTQFRLLVILAEERGHVVPFEELHFRLHGERIDRASSRRALSAHLSYLRTKLSDMDCRDYLENIRGRGYILDVPESEGS
jgi:DNA-binding response OmpR family regulator